MKKKITLKEWKYIQDITYGTKWIRPFCRYTLRTNKNGNYIREQHIGWFLYSLLFIPLHVLQFFLCIWEGGLVEFVLVKPLIGDDIFIEGSDNWKRAKEIYEKENNT